MRKLLVLIAVLSATLNMGAQNDCLSFFPNTLGTVLLHKTYNGEGKMLASTRYTIEEAREDQDGYSTEIAVLVTDSLNKTLDRGYMEVTCDDNVFFLKVKYSFLSPEILDLLSLNTQLLGDFMDYPDTYNNDYPFTGALHKSGGEILLRTTDQSDLVKVRVFNRFHDENEQVMTPAGVYETSKITFDFQVTRDDQTTNYKGTEWYAKNAGIVRSETRDENDLLVSYTELTSITNQ